MEVGGGERKMDWGEGERSQVWREKLPAIVYGKLRANSSSNKCLLYFVST